MEVTEKKIRAPLMLGILFVPMIFCWVLLRKGYSKQDRVIGFGYLVTLYALLIHYLFNIDPQVETNNKISQPISSIVEQKSALPNQCDIYSKKTGDDVLSEIGKPVTIQRIGQDYKGLVVNWLYPQCILTLKIQEKNGINAYRVASTVEVGQSKNGATLNLEAPQGKVKKPEIIRKFEGSHFYEKWGPITAEEPRTLSNCNRYYSYSSEQVGGFNDMSIAGFHGMSVGIELKNDSLTRVAITWYGDSINMPAQWTGVTQQTLKDLMQATEVDTDFDVVKEVVIANQSKNYPEGSDSMPRTEIWRKWIIYTGLSSSELIVGFEVNP